jgi:hypothetical protein
MNWGSQFGMIEGGPTGPTGVGGGFGIPGQGYLTPSLGSLEGYGYGAEPEGVEPGAKDIPEGYLRLFETAPSVVGALGEQLRARRESLRGLIRQRASLKKKIGRTGSAARKQQYKQELAVVNMQIVDLKEFLQSNGEDTGGTSPLPWIIGGVLILGVFGTAIIYSRKKR